jgi:hypothetical protein
MKMYERVFRWSALGLLLITAVAKIVSAGGHAALLDFPDPLFGLANRRVLLGVALIELAVAAGLVSGLNLRLKYLLLAWLSCNFLIYRCALHVLSPGRPCPCLGTLTERLPLSANQVTVVLSVLVGYLLAGSVVMLMCESRITRMTRI